ALVVKPAVLSEDERVGGVVGVGGVDAAEDADADIGDAVAVGVLEKEDVGSGGNDHAAAPELEAGRIVQLVGEDDQAVGLAVVVVVVQGDDGVLELLV